MCHEQAFNPLPFNQCWNMVWQHASGSFWYFSLMMSCCVTVPLSSMSNRVLTLYQLEASVYMIWIFWPWTVLKWTLAWSEREEDTLAFYSSHLLDMQLSLFMVLKNTVTNTSTVRAAKVGLCNNRSALCKSDIFQYQELIEDDSHYATATEKTGMHISHSCQELAKTKDMHS